MTIKEIWSVSTLNNLRHQQLPRSLIGRRKLMKTKSFSTFFELIKTTQQTRDDENLNWVRAHHGKCFSHAQHESGGLTRAHKLFDAVLFRVKVQNDQDSHRN